MAALDERRLAARRRAVAPSAAGRAGATTARVASRALGGRGRARPSSSSCRPGERPLAAPGVEALCLDLLDLRSRGGDRGRRGRARAAGLPLRVRLPEILFDDDAPWLRAVLGRAVGRRLRASSRACSGRPPARTGRRPALVLEYPLQGLNGLAAGVAAGLAGRPPAAVVASPEASLDEIARPRRGHGRRSDPPRGTPPAVEVLAFGRQQVLQTRDQLGRAEGLYEAPGPGEHVGLLLEDAKGYAFPADVDAGGTRLFNARVTNLAPNLDELRDAGVATFIVVQSDLDAAERRAFAAGGLPALAAFAGRERSTTGHLFRGVA